MSGRVLTIDLDTKNWPALTPLTMHSRQRRLGVAPLRLHRDHILKEENQ